MNKLFSKKIFSMLISGIIFISSTGLTIYAQERVGDMERDSFPTMISTVSESADVVELASSNTDKVEDFISRMYTLTLNRKPDKEGLDFWVNSLILGRSSGTQVADYFLNSEELQKKNLSASAYLDILYSALMGRESDVGGKSYWLDFLNNGCSRQGILREFLLSAEFGNICNLYGISRGTPDIKNPMDANLKLTVFVDRIYKQILERNSQPSELNYWTNEILKNGKTAESVCEFFLRSKEFTDKRHSEDKFLGIMYQTFFGRAADTSGLSYWKGLFSRGLSRNDAGTLFAYSSEFANILRSMSLTPTKPMWLPSIPADPTPVPTPTPAPTPVPVPGATIEGIRAEMVRLVNAHRASNGTSALKANDKLNQASQIRSVEISASFSHTRPSGKTPWTSIDEAGYKWRTVGENIAMNSNGNSSSADIALSLFNQWKNSDGHNKNMLNNSFTEIGFGVYLQGRSVYATQLFAAPG